MKMKNHLTRGASLATAMAVITAPMLLVPSASAAEVFSLPDHIVNGDFEYPDMWDMETSQSYEQNSRHSQDIHVCPSHGSTCVNPTFGCAPRADISIDAEKFGWKSAPTWTYLQKNWTGDLKTTLDSSTGRQRTYSGEDGTVELGTTNVFSGHYNAELATERHNMVDSTHNAAIY